MSVVAKELRDHGRELYFCGETLILDPSGCLYWPDQQLLVVSDLHLEKGSSFAVRRSTFMPPYDTQATLERLAMCVSHLQPRTIISLGDSFHDLDASARLPDTYRLALRQLMDGRDWVWVSGNHDPQPPKDLGGTYCTEIQIGPLHFKHEPEIQFRLGEIAGHLHPSARIRQRGKSIRRRCMASDGKRLVLPAFGEFTGGLNLRDEAFTGLFQWESLDAWLLGKNDVYRISSQQLQR